MPRNLCKIVLDDILPMESYEEIRKEARDHIIALKEHRRIAVGPYGTFCFENYDTMLFQVHEMLYIEKGGLDQIPDELSVYNPLIPQGQELVATLFFEIDDPAIRKPFLETIGGVEHKACLIIEEETIWGIPKHDVEHTNEAGKASAVHFIHFPLTLDQAKNFENGAVLAIQHPNYNYKSPLTPLQIRALGWDIQT